MIDIPGGEVHRDVMGDCQETTEVQDEFRRVVDALPGLVWTALPDGYVDFLNQHWCEYTGLSVDEGYGHGWQKAIHPDDLPELLECWRSILASGEPGGTEARFRRFDGEYRWFLIYSSPLRDAAGRVVKWVGVNTDIEDRRRAEALLAGEKQLLEMVADGRSMSEILEALCKLVESTTSGCYCSVVLVDPTGMHLEHGAAPSLPASVINSIIRRPVNLDSGPCAQAAYLNEQVIAADLTSETRWADDWCPMAMAHGLQACWSTPILSTTGKVLGAFAIYYDQPRKPTSLHQSLIEQFTHIASIAVERAQSDAALKQSEAFLAQAQHVSSTGSFFWHPATDEITWSEEAYRIFELDPEVPITLERIFTRVHPEDIPSVQEMLIRQKRDGGDFEHDHRLLMPDSSVKYLHLVAHATRDHNDQLEYFAAVQDVTERRLSEEALSQLQSEFAHVARAMSLCAMTASIAHEINQPLSGILNNASTCIRMLASDPPNVEGARETARRTIRDGNRVSDVITRLRALFAREKATTESVDLNDAIREVIALSLSELQRNRVILRMDLAADLPPVNGDRIQLQQVILNLLQNSTDAMRSVDDRPRRLVISTELDEENNVRLKMQDVGVGFEPQSMNKLFEAFYTTKNNGMGIGLFLSRSIIESHDGRLWAAPNDGPGATFAFSIPSRIEDANEADGIRHSDV
jgi:PAS domain S-box-containing protein